jgi:hypothetical protein
VDRKQERAFEVFVAESGDSLLRLATLLTSETGLGEDVYQETLHRLAARWSRVQNPRAFCRQVMHNIVIDQARLKWRQVPQVPQVRLAAAADTITVSRRRFPRRAPAAGRDNEAVPPAPSDAFGPGSGCPSGPGDVEPSASLRSSDVSTASSPTRPRERLTSPVSRLSVAMAVRSKSFLRVIFSHKFARVAVLLGSWRPRTRDSANLLPGAAFSPWAGADSRYNRDILEWTSVKPAAVFSQVANSFKRPRHRVRPCRAQCRCLARAEQSVCARLLRSVFVRRACLRLRAPEAQPGLVTVGGGLGGECADGAGTGLSFPHYPPQVREVVAVGPEPCPHSRAPASSSPVCCAPFPASHRARRVPPGPAAGKPCLRR